MPASRSLAQQWLEGVIEPASAVFARSGGIGSIGLVIDARRTTPDHAQMLAVAAHAVPDGAHAALEAMIALGIQPESMLRIQRAGPVSTLSEALAELFDANGFQRGLVRHGFGDAMHVLAGDPHGISCILASALSRRHCCSQDEQLRWQLTAAHIAAGFRLRSQYETASFRRDGMTLRRLRWGPRCASSMC